jgi:hypothetical protein
MGFFDRLTGRKPEAASSTSPTGAFASDAALSPTGVPARLAAAREKLEAKDLPGAMAVYEELLAHSGDRADVLVAISGDLGTQGHIAEIVELVAPRYDAERHGPATGLNLLQAYLALRNADAAQHVLDILFALNRPELEERLYGFSNAIAELINERHMPLDPGAAAAIPDGAPKVGLATLSKPVWFYGLEPLAEKILPPKSGKLRKIAFAQLAAPGAYPDVGAALKQPEDELGRLARALPLWFAETFYFSPHYLPSAAVAVISAPGEPSRAMLFNAEWTSENLRQLEDTTDGGLDYIFTGALRQQSGDYEVLLRVWEVKKFRERKTFTARWTPATADVELLRLHEQVRTFMEWSPEKTGVPYAVPVAPRQWLDTLGASLGTFLAEKTLAPAAQIPVTTETLNTAGRHASASTTASLAFLTLRSRAAKQGVAVPAGDIALAQSDLVAPAAALLG